MHNDPPVLSFEFKFLVFPRISQGFWRISKQIINWKSYTWLRLLKNSRILLWQVSFSVHHHVFLCCFARRSIIVVFQRARASCLRQSYTSFYNNKVVCGHRLFGVNNLRYYIISRFFKSTSKHSQEESRLIILFSLYLYKRNERFCFSIFFLKWHLIVIPELAMLRHLWTSYYNVSETKNFRFLSSVKQKTQKSSSLVCPKLHSGLFYIYKAHFQAIFGRR